MSRARFQAWFEGCVGARYVLHDSASSGSRVPFDERLVGFRCYRGRHEFARLWLGHELDQERANQLEAQALERDIVNKTLRLEYAEMAASR